MERLVEEPVGPSLPKLGPAPGSHPASEALPGHRAVIVEPHPAVQAVLEHLLFREGYAVEACGEASEAALRQTPGRTPVLLLVGAENGDGLYVFQTRDVAGVLATLTGGAEFSQGSNLSAFGIHAFVPKPFGIVDIQRVVRAVGGFDGRKKGPPRKS